MTVTETTTNSEISSLEAEVTRHFGDSAYTVALSAHQPMGRRIHGIDLTKPLNTQQVKVLVNLLDYHSVISFPKQGGQSFQLSALERLANHFGAPVPHPKNYANYIDYKQNRVPLALLPRAKQTAALCNAAFADDIQCVDGADSPAVYVVTNLSGTADSNARQGRKVARIRESVPKFIAAASRQRPDLHLLIFYGLYRAPVCHPPPRRRRRVAACAAPGRAAASAMPFSTSTRDGGARWRAAAYSCRLRAA